MNLQLKANLATTPAVHVADLKRSLEIAERVYRPDGKAEDQRDEFADAMGRRFPQSKTLALWSRCRALLLFQGDPMTIEHDKLSVHELRAIKESGVETDVDLCVRVELAARIGAASKHPLDSDGRFTPGFREAIHGAKAAMMTSNADLSGQVN